ncbi:MAG: M28 family peptidase [Chloroflexi bacterium]|nr:M28 family peptidase [Chloroflexota bacterium]
MPDTAGATEEHATTPPGASGPSGTPEVASDPMAIIRDLAALPHRGTTTPQETQAAQILSDRLKSLGAEVHLESFATPRVYIWPVLWMLLGLIAGLLLAPLAPWASLALAFASAVLLFLYFDWRASPTTYLAPRGRSVNVIGRRTTPGQKTARTAILMAHYDSAPASLLYLPSLVRGFRQSLLISLALVALAPVLLLLGLLRIGEPVTGVLRIVLALYFLVQGAMTAVDYLRLGYVNGANDNATGVGVALATAARLWADPPPDLDVLVVLTGAEEAGMVGSHAYFRAHRRELDPENTYLFNLDNCGAGNLCFVELTGMVTDVGYRNVLWRQAKALASEPLFADVKPGTWRTGDFDSIWFARGGIPSLTIMAQDHRGCAPNLHRPTDTIDRVEPALVAHGVDFAEALVRRLASSFSNEASPQTDESIHRGERGVR